MHIFFLFFLFFYFFLFFFIIIDYQQYSITQSKTNKQTKKNMIKYKKNHQKDQCLIVVILVLPMHFLVAQQLIDAELGS